MDAKMKISVLVILLCGCSGKAEITLPEPRRPIATVFEFSGEGGTLPCDIIFDSGWTISGDCDWSEITPDYGNGKTTVHISTDEFTGNLKIRTFEYIAESYGERIYLTVVQRNDGPTAEPPPAYRFTAK